MLVKKIHFPDHLSFTQNIADADVNHHINDAEKYDFIPKVGTSMIAALADACVESASWTIWAAGTYDVAGTIVIHNSNVYILNALSTTDEPGTSDRWLKKELYSFWYTNVKPFMVFSAAARYMVYAGKKFTQAGVREAFEDTSNEVDSKGKATIINDLKGKASVEHNLMMKALAVADWTFDGNEYDEPNEGVTRDRSKKLGGFRAI